MSKIDPIAPLEPGGFYLCSQPGTFTDPLTGIKIPGPTVKISAEDERSIIDIEHLPDPVQIPHKKLIVDFKDRDRKIREERAVPFDRLDEFPLHEGLSAAVQCGVIYRVSDEVMKEHHPKAWAARLEEKVLNTDKKIERSAKDLVGDHYKAKARAEAEAEAEALKAKAKAELEARKAKAKAANSAPDPDSDESSPTDKGQSSVPPPPPAKP